MASPADTRHTAIIIQLFLHNFNFGFFQSVQSRYIQTEMFPTKFIKNVPCQLQSEMQSKEHLKLYFANRIGLVQSAENLEQSNCTYYKEKKKK